MMKINPELTRQAEADAAAKLARYRFAMPDLRPLVTGLRRIVSLHVGGSVISTLAVQPAIDAARDIDHACGVAFGQTGDTKTRLVTVLRQISYGKLAPVELDLRVRAQAVMRILFKVEQGATTE